MAVTTTTAFTGPLTADGVAPLPFTFQAASADEIEVVLDGEVVSPSAYTVALNADDTGSVTPTSAWTGEVYINSKPDFGQEADWERYAPYFPDQLVPPLDKLAKQNIYLKESLDRAILTPREGGVEGLYPVILADGSTGFSSGTGADAGLRSELATNSASLLNLISSYSGAIARTIGDWFDEHPSAMSFIPLTERVKIRLGTSTADVTAYIQKALDTGKDVFVPNGTYMVDAETSLKPLSNQKIILEKGAVIQAIPNSAEISYIIDIRDVENVTIEGGGTIKGERDDHVGTTGESGMCIAIYNSSNITIRDVTCQDAWGDGIYVGGTGTTGQSSDVLIDNVICTNNRRNNLSVVAVDGCAVRGGSFIGAGGADGVTGAMCGIDVEPNPTKAAVNKVLLDGATCAGNDGPGISVSQSIATNITVRDAYSCDNGGSGLSSGKAGPGLKVFGGSFNGNAEYGIHIFGDASTVVMGPLIDGVEAKENTLDGVFIGGNVMRFDILNFKTSLNGRHGVRCARLDAAGVALGTYCDDGLVRGKSWNNSQTTTATYDNIHLGTGTHFVTVENCWVRKNEPTSIISTVVTTPTNQPRYGINSAANEYNTIRNNDVTDGGATANMAIQTNNIVHGNIGFKTEARVSGTFACDTVGTRSVVIAHGLGYTPPVSHCQATVGDTSGYGFKTNAPRFRSATATNVTYDVDVTTAGGVATNAGQLAVSIERPSPL